MLTPKQIAEDIRRVHTILEHDQKSINYQPWVARIIDAGINKLHLPPGASARTVALLVEMQAELERTPSLYDCHAVITKHMTKSSMTVRGREDNRHYLIGSNLSSILRSHRSGVFRKTRDNRAEPICKLLRTEIGIRKTVVSYLAFMLGTLESTSPVSILRGQFDVLRLIFNDVMAVTPAFTEKSICELNAPKVSAMKVVSFFKEKGFKGQPAFKAKDLHNEAEDLYGDATLDL